MMVITYPQWKRDLENKEVKLFKIPKIIIAVCNREAFSKSGLVKFCKSRKEKQTTMMQLKMDLFLLRWRWKAGSWSCNVWLTP